jgi:hypothetical protein
LASSYAIEAPITPAPMMIASACLVIGGTSGKVQLIYQLSVKIVNLGA